MIENVHYLINFVVWMDIQYQLEFLFNILQPASMWEEIEWKTVLQCMYHIQVNKFLQLRFKPLVVTIILYLFFKLCLVLQ